MNNMVFPGFNHKKKSSIGGDFDGDGVKNRKDCEPLNWKKQGPEHKVRYKIKKVGEKYMIYDSQVGSFLIGYSFEDGDEAKKFLEDNL